jgi:LysM repeat protein
MTIKNLPKYKDMRGKLQTKGTYSTVPLTNRDWLVIHHSATLSGSAEAYARYHTLTLGWQGIGYHFVIEQDGTIKQCHDLNVKSYHVGNSNARSIGICLTGSFTKGTGQKPTQAQKDSLYLLVKEIQKEVPSIKKVLGHNECPDYSWKNCPGDGWNYKDVLKGVGVTTPKPTPVVQPLPHQYVIQPGDTFYSIAYKHAGLDVSDLIQLNPKVNPKTLQVGQTINLAKPVFSSTKYTVKKGDTLWDIARAYQDVEVADIKSANRLKSDVLQIGQVLVIPTKAKTSTHIGEIVVLATELNVRDDADFNSKILRTLKKGQTNRVYRERNGLYSIGADQWVSANPKYVKFTPVK